jgi:hypothetical protein
MSTERRKRYGNKRKRTRRSKKRKSGFVVCGAPEPSTDCQIQACHWDVDHDAGKFKIQGFKAQDARSFIIFVYWESEIRDPEGNRANFGGI